MAPASPSGVLSAIAGHTGLVLDPASARPVNGGCIHRSTALTARDGRRVFLKLNRAAALPVFEAEAAGLAALREANEVRVPATLGLGLADGQAWLLLEYLDLADGPATAAHRLGAQLARLHRQTAPRFGFPADNFIGRTPQSNRWADSWQSFFREQRLGPQLDLARENGYHRQFGTRPDEIVDSLPLFFRDHEPAPSLLHGDLWGGNWGALADATPVLFDPAVYHGDRETDIAMTELFGGFGPAFRAGYEAAWPLPPGYGVRRDLYNLYHVLNHLNLFGGSYLSQSVALMDRLLAAIARDTT